MTEGNNVESSVSNQQPGPTASATSDPPSSTGITAQIAELKRPKSSWAQVVQACVSAAGLAVAYIVYVNTVIPAQRLILAEEKLLRVENASLVFVVNEFVRLLLTRTADIPRISHVPPPSGRTYGTEFPRMGFYFAALRQMYGEEWQHNLNVDYFSGNTTGKQIIDDILSGPLINMLPDAQRRPFVERVNSFIANYSNNGVFSTNFAIPPPLDSIDGWNQEEKRRLELHKQFVEAIVAMREALLKQTKSTP
jgi:hypothetical protein